MRAVCYARVSSAAQRERETIASQLRQLPEFVARQGWTLTAPVTTYVDDGRTAQAGKLDQRTGLAALLRDAAAGLFDVVVVADIDRLTRSEDLRERGAILGALQAARVKIATLSNGVLDLATDEGDLIGNISGYFAAAWGRKHKARIKAGKDTAIARGRKPAGPTAYGWRYSKATGTWTIHPDEAATVREIFARVAAGESCVVIADDLSAREVPTVRGTTHWTRHKVWLIVRRRAYLGTWIANKARALTIEVPPILTLAQYDAAQAALIAHGKRGLRRTKHVYLLEGLGQCGHCGAPIAIRSPTPQRTGTLSPAAYVCRNRKLRRPLGAARCDAPIVWVQHADPAVWDAIKLELADPSLPAAIAARLNAQATAAQAWQGDVVDWQRKLARLGELEPSLLAKARRGLISDGALDKELQAIARERNMLRRQLATAERAAATAQRTVTVAQVRAALKLLAITDAATLDERRALAERLIPVGGAVFVDGKIKLSLTVASLAGATQTTTQSQAIDLALGSAYKTQHETQQRLRIVALPRRKVGG